MMSAKPPPETVDTIIEDIRQEALKNPPAEPARQSTRTLSWTTGLAVLGVIVIASAAIVQFAPREGRVFLYTESPEIAGETIRRAARELGGKILTRLKLPPDSRGTREFTVEIPSEKRGEFLKAVGAQGTLSLSEPSAQGTEAGGDPSKRVLHIVLISSR